MDAALLTDVSVETVDRLAACVLVSVEVVVVSVDCMRESCSRWSTWTHVC